MDCWTRFFFLNYNVGEAGDKPYTKASRLTEAITKGEEMDSKGEEGLKQPLSVVGGEGVRSKQ